MKKVMSAEVLATGSLMCKPSRVTVELSINMFVLLNELATFIGITSLSIHYFKL